MNPGARLHRQEPDGSCYLLKSELIQDFKDFLRIDLRLCNITVQGHVFQVKRFLKWVKQNNVEEVSQDTLRSYLREFSNSSAFTYANVLKTLRRLFRDFLSKPELVESFRLPKKPFKPRRVPKRADLRRFYEALDSDIGRALFLMYASTGLRKREMLSLKFENIDFSNRMVLPSCHEGETKQSFVSFYNEEAEKALNQYLASRKDREGKVFRIGTHTFLDLWKRANQKTELHITPQTLREWFCTEMVSKGVSDSYVDAFCGRVPRSILAKHYLDYSPEKLKEVYEKAELRVLCTP